MRRTFAQNVSAVSADVAEAVERVVAISGQQYGLVQTTFEQRGGGCLARDGDGVGAIHVLPRPSENPLPSQVKHAVIGVKSTRKRRSFPNLAIDVECHRFERTATYTTFSGVAGQKNPSSFASKSGTKGLRFTLRV